MFEGDVLSIKEESSIDLAAKKEQLAWRLNQLQLPRERFIGVTGEFDEQDHQDQESEGTEEQGDVQNMLRMMHQVMGTNDDCSVVSEEETVNLPSLLSKLQQLKSESEFNKAEADRCKRLVTSPGTQVTVRIEGIEKLSRISNFRTMYSHSFPCDGVNWKIGIIITKGKVDAYLMVAELHGRKRWSSSVFFKMDLVSHKSNSLVHTVESDGAQLFDTKTLLNGIHLASNDILFDKEKEFVREGVILLRVHMECFSQFMDTSA